MAGISCNSVLLNNNQHNVNQRWVVDSGANQHMIASESLLCESVDVSKLNLRVGHPNGTSAPISKIGNLQLSNSLTLFDVFAVPEFNVNLLSVYKLCKDSNCKVIFDQNQCVIQDSQSKGMVESGSQSGGYTTLIVNPQVTFLVLILNVSLPKLHGITDWVTLLIKL